MPVIRGKGEGGRGKVKGKGRGRAKGRRAAQPILYRRAESVIGCDVADEDRIHVELVALSQRGVQSRCNSGRVVFVAEVEKRRSQRSQPLEITAKGKDGHRLPAIAAKSDGLRYGIDRRRAVALEQQEWC